MTTPLAPSPGCYQLQLLGQDPSLQAPGQQAVLGGTQRCGEAGSGPPQACGSWATAAHIA